MGRTLHLHDLEADLHSRMAPEIEQVMRHKRVLLFDEMMSICFLSVAAWSAAWCRVFLWEGRSPRPKFSIKPKPRIAEQSLDDLWRGARRIQERTFATTRGSDDRDLDLAVHAATLDEVSKGWFFGPSLPPNFLSAWVRGFLPVGLVFARVRRQGSLTTSPR